ncbi:MBL fold metallo-hydrolase [Paracoccaceae bacterium GXU_MW_L88]
MTPVFATSATMTVKANRLLRGQGGTLRLPVRYAFFTHPESGPCLIDTGYSAALFRPGNSFATKAYARLFKPTLTPEGQIDAFLSRQNLTPGAIKRVFLSHLHADHICGLDQLPSAQIIGPKNTCDTLSTKPLLARVHHGFFADLMPTHARETMQDFSDFPRRTAQGLEGYDLFGDGSLLAIPLGGHALGHHSFLFTEARLLYAVDVTWLHALLPADAKVPFPACLIAADRAAERRSREIVAQFQADGGSVVLCHDPAGTPWDDPISFGAVP